MVEVHSQEFHAVIIHVLNIPIVIQVNKVRMTQSIQKYFTCENFQNYSICNG